MASPAGSTSSGFDPSFVTSSTEITRPKSSVVALSATLNYEVLRKEAYDTGLTLPSHLKIHVLSALLSMPIEQLPTLEDRFFLTPSYNELFNSMSDYDVMKEVIYDSSRKTQINCVNIKVGDTVFRISGTASDCLSMRIFKPSQDSELGTPISISKDGPTTEFDKLVVDSSPAHKSRMLYASISPFLFADVIGIVNDYAGLPREGRYESFADLREIVPIESDRFHYLGRFRRVTQSTFTDELFVREKLGQLYIYLDWYAKARPTLEKILLQTYNPDGRNYTAEERNQIRQIMEFGDAIDLGKEFTSKEATINYYNDIKVNLGPFLFPSRGGDLFLGEVFNLVRQDNPGMDTELMTTQKQLKLVKIGDGCGGRAAGIISGYISLV